MTTVRKSLLPLAWIAVLLMVIYAGCSDDKKNGTNPPGPKTGTLIVSSTPSGASITLDGTAETDTTPATFTDIDSGSHTITLSKAAYDDWDSTVNVPAGGTATATATLELTMYALNLFAVGNGSVYKDPNASEYLPNTEVEISAVPDPGWEFDEWTGGHTGSKNPDTLVMTQDWTTTAVFTEIQSVWDSIRIEGATSLEGGGAMTRPIVFLDTSESEYIVVYRGTGWLGDPATGDYIIQFDPEELDSVQAIITAWDDIDEDNTLEDGEPIGWWDIDGEGDWDDRIWLHRGDTIPNADVLMYLSARAPRRLINPERVKIK
ncbi:MAG: PEGA domain-containing protein [Candidatus Zixiibacteriota bacterium]